MSEAHSGLIIQWHKLKINGYRRQTNVKNKKSVKKNCAHPCIDARGAQ